ncbi:MAG: 2-oxoglutarate dehydrogenase E1 subunit family protein, partial [Steroidobacteraceae bacterium]
MLEPTPLYGGNAAWLEEVLYDQYLNDPASVPAHWREYFERLAPRIPGERPRRGSLEAAIAARARAARPAAGGA